MVDTGAHTETGGRVARLRQLLSEDPFIVTYGDSLSDVDVHAVIDQHQRRGHLVTVTAVRPPSRFGGLRFEGDKVAGFIEKPQIGEGWINGGYMVFEPSVADHIEGDATFPVWNRAHFREASRERHGAPLHAGGPDVAFSFVHYVRV